MRWIDTGDSLGKLTMGIDGDFVWVKNVESEVMWSVAPLSKIHDLVNAKLVETLWKRDKPATFA